MVFLVVLVSRETISLRDLLTLDTSLTEKLPFLMTTSNKNFIGIFSDCETTCHKINPGMMVF